ncbi:hypothetical protein [Roseibium sp.]|uniref:hypothetical protein n=1 Tax=Roseibium sp. TaxID=1936156 RepID=UPI003B50582A
MDFQQFHQTEYSHNPRAGLEPDQEALERHVWNTGAKAVARALNIQPRVAPEDCLISVRNALAVNLRQETGRRFLRLRIERMREEPSEGCFLAGKRDRRNIARIGGGKRQKQPGAQLRHPAVPDHDAAVFFPGVEQELRPLACQTVLYI